MFLVNNNTFPFVCYIIGGLSIGKGVYHYSSLVADNQERKALSTIIGGIAIIALGVGSSYDLSNSVPDNFTRESYYFLFAKKKASSMSEIISEIVKDKLKDICQVYETKGAALTEQMQAELAQTVGGKMREYLYHECVDRVFAIYKTVLNSLSNRELSDLSKMLNHGECAVSLQTYIKFIELEEEPIARLFNSLPDSAASFVEQSAQEIHAIVAKILGRAI